MSGDLAALVSCGTRGTSVTLEETKKLPRSGCNGSRKRLLLGRHGRSGLPQGLRLMSPGRSAVQEGKSVLPRY